MRRLLLFASVVAVLLQGSEAAAHGDLQRSDPERGDHVRKPPTTIALDFAEPPTDDSVFEVTDGCNEN
ncbi:MAG TPA: copper resistance protein CopC, partial [Actinomycetota bacterium]|nr:copper resistance protein CopC [Actinomycetota bacterium]